jgi:hypothetical protein
MMTQTLHTKEKSDRTITVDPVHQNTVWNADKEERRREGN